jgi:tetratricopeptide (TPR) repeat protein
MRNSGSLICWDTKREEKKKVKSVIAVVVTALALATAWAIFSPAAAPAAEGGSTNEKVLQVWRLYDEGEVERALVIAEGIHDAQGDSRLILTALIGFLYEKQGRDDEALRRLDSVKPALREALVESARGDGGEAVAPVRHRSFLRLYRDVLRARGFLLYAGGNCDEAVPELQEMMGVVGAPNPLALSMIGSCVYRGREYDEAREYFEESYRWYEPGELKDQAAYNVAAMYGIQGNAEESVRWLGTASESGGSRWIEAAGEDKDFDPVRDTGAFLELSRRVLGP